MPRLLSVSRNPRLLATRNDALALAGFTVVSPRSPEQTLLLLHQEKFDAVIIGHSIEPELRKRLIASIHEASPGLPIAFVFLPAEDPGEEPLADFAVDISHGPMPLLQALRRHLETKREGSNG
jgi:DNA-binding NtrC family response regulator